MQAPAVTRPVGHDHFIVVDLHDEEIARRIAALGRAV